MSKTHVYFVPGLAAGKEIFRNIHLPEKTYEWHVIEWLIPEKNESIEAYAARMAQSIAEPDPVLVGVSFGGVMVQEMKAHLDVKKVIVISSIKCRSEMPRRMKLARSTKAYKLFPTSLASSVTDFTVFAIGPRSKKRLRLYNEYLSVRDKTYLDWALAQVVNWKRQKADKEVQHIHGDQDAVFPIKYIQDAKILKGGTHVMILNKGSVVSKMLQNIIENDGGA
ncbi:MAG TPA: alpha/beta hydrolase [Flavobacteriaceae bacterium]|nr:alpha/beta hydrolase [Flavobacteriaceae bacterium]HPF11293.1 alpha/beta hydrolase [Flavobacteriaceae bacterium]HQU22215.1 alpha/beta hydrolase [Flavobacteriaceae bacterium]HQU64488.1 alpha/beta hydrolase [Flavobacteriaceae bacterium]HRW44619.1 alpha/beta hydrolase [Flavobacteriaceae bacterium]